MEIWKKFENIEVSNLGHLKTRQHKDGTWGGTINSNGYPQVRLGKCQYVHRIVMNIFNDIALDDPRQIDHINGDRADNRVENLRMVSQRDNLSNAKVHRNGKLLGANYHKIDKVWFSQIRIDGKLKHLGSFKTEQEAHNRYMEELNKIQGEKK